MTSNKSSVFKHPLIVELIIVLVVAVSGSYLTLLQASIPRSEVEQKIKLSEDRQGNSMNRLEDKQDQILNKLEDLQVEVAIIKGKLESKGK